MGILTEKKKTRRSGKPKVPKSNTLRAWENYYKRLEDYEKVQKLKEKAREKARKL